MIVVIASSNNTPEATLDSRFGRCAFFAVYDSLSNQTQFHINPYKDADDWAGKSSVQWMKDHHAQMVIAAEMGEKIKPLLDKLQIQIVIPDNPELLISEIIEKISTTHKRQNQY